MYGRKWEAVPMKTTAAVAEIGIASRRLGWRFEILASFPAHYLEELFHWRGGHCGHRRSQHVRLHGGREIEKRLPMLLYGEFVKRLQPLAEDDSGIEDFEFADGILTEKVDGQDAMQWVKLLGGFADSSRGVEIQVDPVRGLSEGVAVNVAQQYFQKARDHAE